MAVDHPMLLFLALFSLAPLVAPQNRLLDYSWNWMLPGDVMSIVADTVLRIAGAGAIAALVLGLSGLHNRGQAVEKIGHGAHMVLLLDRSRSMDNSFAGTAPDGREESKAVAARRLLTEFVSQRSDDLVGIATFSTSGMVALPMSGNLDAVKAAIDPLGHAGLAFTHIAKGLVVALSLFPETRSEGSRILILVSDGAAAIDTHRESEMRKLIQNSRLRLYWIFLRTANHPGLFDQPQDPADDTPEARPERYLHLFFQSLKVPYKAYEADDPESLERAIADIDQLERLPVKHLKLLPRRNLDRICYGIALICLATLIVGNWMEVKRS